MAALLRDDDVDADYVNSKCGAVLVKIKMVSISKDLIYSLLRLATDLL